MDNVLTGHNLIKILRNLLRNENNIIESMNFKEMYSMAKFHSLENMYYYAYNKYVKDNNIEVDNELLDVLKKDNKLAIIKTATFDCELELLMDSLKNNQISFMLMKGNVIKKIYPSMDMRSMADIDIYFDKTKSKFIKRMMKDLGYYSESYEKGNHDTYMKEPFMNVEMHRDLMNECYEFSKYYKNFFSRLNKISDYEYEFSKEDYYVFMIAHSAKHFSNGGTGIRSVIDEYIYLINYENVLDFEYIYQELEKLGLVKFEKNLKNLSKYWFLDIELNENELNLLKDMESFIFDSGTYGLTYHSILNEFVGEDTVIDLNSSKAKYILRRAFPPYKTMCSRNPIIKKCVILLPWFWFTRLLSGIFKVKRVKAEVSNTKNMSEEEIKKNKEMHENIGA